LHSLHQFDLPIVAERIVDAGNRFWIIPERPVEPRTPANVRLGSPTDILGCEIDVRPSPKAATKRDERHGG
jgi:hypothetical protein